MHAHVLLGQAEFAWPSTTRSRLARGVGGYVRTGDGLRQGRAPLYEASTRAVTATALADPPLS
ncbi:hypothetical protein [Streptomyces canus]|uniref:TrwC relaxase domain-containing protein n=1 Tax=Streptomyces canus TaxID=58343 RepID=A0AAW8FXK3_9ACTN|nr:hypothetical protein [Streptomyces canus]MDQ0757773.1 hypothetical protein [Streptomyces canus]MDQ0913705.1 hypothetical protein [Streptomyces canus]MDQ1073271.1 hypothetical protein [Streptomyces canus]